MSDIVDQILSSITPVATNQGAASVAVPNQSLGSSVDEIIDSVSGAASTAPVVAQSSTPKLSRDQLTAAVVGARRGAGVNRDLEQDLMSLNDADLTKIYGPGFDVFRNDLHTEALDQRKTMGTQRDPVSFVTDSLAQAAAGGIGFVGDMATLASGIPTRIGSKDYSLSGKPMSESDKQIPMAIAEATDWAVNGLTSLTSNEYQDRVRLGEFASKYESDKNNQERDAAIAAGGSPTLENWKGIGKNFLDAGEIYTSDPMLASGVVSGALGSVLPSAKLVGFARSLITESATYKAAQLAGAISPQGMPKLMSKLADYTANGFTASAVGVTEAASTYSQTLQDVMDLPVEDLLKSPEYFRLIENGVDPLKARMQVAENAAEDSFFTALPLATATSLLSLKFDAAPLTVFKDGMKEGLSGVGREILGQTTEELLQGASGQYAQNSAIKSNINKNQDLTAGVGEQAAMGAIGGAGMSGIIAGPRAALRTTQNISEALIDSVIGKKQTPAVVPEVLSDMTVAAQKAAKAKPSKLGTAISSATDTLKQTIKDTVAAVKPSLKAGAVVAANELGQIAPLVQTAKEKLSAGFAKTKEVAGPYIEAGVNKSTDVVNQVSSKVGSEIKNAATNAEVATRDWIANTNEKNLPKGVSQIIEPADNDTPDDLVGVVQPKTDVLSTVNNIVRGLTDSKINARTLSDSAVLYVQTHVEKLRAALPMLPADVREQVEKVLTSPQLKYVAAKLQDIDMTKAVGKTVADVKRMARLNPGNTNPDEIDRILKQDNKDLTDEDVKNLTAARDIAIALNNHSTRKVTVNQGDKGVTLGAKITQSDEPLTASEVVSRSVQVDGLPGLRSVGQYASDIMRGGQNKDGIFVDDKGGKVDSKNVAKQFTMFVQHMINKVDALNRSHAANGKNLGFESLYKGQMMVPAQDARSAKSVAYHPGNEGSMKNAQAIHNDAQAAVDVYNILVDRFPEKFPDGPKDLMDLEGTMKDIASQETPEAETQSAPEAKPKGMDEVKAVKEEDQPHNPDFKARDSAVAGPNNSKFLMNLVPMTKGQFATLIEKLSAFVHPKIWPIIRDYLNGITELGILSSKDESTAVGGSAFGRSMSIAKHIFESLVLGDRSALHVVLHEMGHVFDGFRGGLTMKQEWADLMSGEISKIDPTSEIGKLLKSYAYLYKGSERSREVFAELFALFAVNPEQMRKDLPNVAAFIEKSISEAYSGDWSLGENDSQGLSETSSEKVKPSSELKPGETRDATPEETEVVLGFLRAALPRFLVPNLKVYVENYIEDANGFVQGGHHLDGKITFSPKVMARLMENATKRSSHIVRHEFGHYVDSFGDFAVSQSNAWKQAVAEFNLFVETQADAEQLKLLAYTLSYKGKKGYAKEIFADLFAIMAVKPEFVQNNMPKAYALLQDAMVAAMDPNPDAPAATPETPTTVIEDVSTPVEIEEVGVSSTDKPLDSRDNLPDAFRKTFTERAEEAQFNNARELLSLVETQVSDSQGFVDFVLQYAAPIYGRMNARLSEVKYSSKGGSTILEQFQKDDSILKIKRFKPLMFVNKETGKYDPRILSLAVTSVLDYLSGAHSSSSAVLQDSLDENRVLTSDMSEQQLKDYMQSVSIRQVVETMARKLPSLLNLDVNTDAQMGDIRGATEGLLKEIFSATAQVTDLIEIRKIPVKTVEYMDEDGTAKTRNALTPSIILTQALKNYQKLIGLNGKQAVTQLLNPEDLTGPTLNKPPETVAQTQNRGGVRLSTFEKEVQRNMQSISHTLAPVAKFVTDLGEDMLFDLLGGKDVGSIHDDHPYRRSVEGKNLSIRNDYQDAIEIVDAILGAETGDKTQVFYPVGITRVGRHQMKGPNPQNNKILRVFVTPTHSTLDMENNQQHKDWFWLTVAQASGLAKAEKHDHMKIYAETEAKFREKYSEAVGIALEYLRTGEMNQEGFKNAMAPFRKAGAVTMAQINSVFAVAALDYAKTKNDPEALQKFETSLSFELDGLTDGPGNMMVNFGQGYISPQDYENLRRVGYFLGEHDMTTNEFYTQKGAQDFYEVTTNTGQSILAQMRGKFSSEVDAVVRFAARFGDLEVVTNEDGSLSYQMTRNTAKGPVTKTVYGSSAKGIAEGLGQEMLNEFYRTMIEEVGSNNAAEVLLYPELEQDFALLFGDKFPKGKDWKLTWVDDKGKNLFVDTIKETLAQAMSEAAKHSIGDKITRVNDSLVFVTNVQAQFLKLIFQSRLQKLLLNDPDVERRNGKPVFETLSMQKFMGLVKEVSKLAPSYFNGVQTLNIGSFEGTVSDNVEFSDNFEEGMRMKSSVLEPGDAGVKVIPYITQGRGDAMMMNYIYGNENFPKKSIYVFDGVEIPIDMIGEYSKQINEAVAENWKQNVLQDVVADYTRFLDSMPEEEKSFLSDAFELVLKNQSKNSMARFENVNGILGQLQNFAAQNKARKDAIEEMPRSVNHMAGANDSVNLGPEGNLSLYEINDKIKEKFSDPTPPTKEEEAKAAAQFDKLAVTTGALLLDALAKVKMNKRLAAVVGVLRAAKPDVRVVVGSPAQILAHRLNEEVTNASTPPNGQGFYDPLNNTIYLMSTAHETMVHELVHAITLSLVQKVYEGSGSVAQKGAVERLEILMSDFLELDFSKASKAAQRAAKTTKGEILRAQGMNDTFGKTKALNEFMAWTLANDALSRELNNTVTGMVTQMIKKVRALMARILGTVSHDMFSNILFNTQVLLEQEEKVQSPTIDVTIGGKTETIQIGQDEEEDFDLTEDWDETGVFSSNNDGGNGGNGDNGPSGRGPQSPAQGPTNFWINLITKKIDEMKAPSRFRRDKLTELNKYIDNSQKAFDVLVSGGYIFNYEQELTFKAIHMVLAFEMNLNANSLVAMNKMFNFVTDNLTPAMFAVDGQNKYQAMMDSFGGTKNTQGVSDAIATFFALSQTSNDYRGALDNLPKPPAEGGMKFSSFNEFVASSAAILMRQAVGEIQTGNVEAKNALDALSKSILNQDTEREYTVLRTLMSSFDSADRFTKGALRKLAEFGESVNRKTPNTNKLVKTIAQSVELATGLLNERKAADSFEAAKLLTHMGTDLSWAIPFQEFIAEMIGTDKKNSGLIAMLDITKKHVSALRQQYRDNLPIILQNAFSTKPTAEQWKAAHSSMGQSDFASVFVLSKSDLSFKVFSDKAYRDRQIKNYEDTIKRQVTPGMATDILEKAQQLADQMNGKGVGHMLYANAFAINHFVGDRTKENLVEVIDKLVTFYSINGKPQEELDAVSAMYDADPEAMKNLVVYMQALNLEEERKLQNPPETPPHLLDEDGNPLYGDPVMKMKLNGYKGYVPNFGMPDVQLTIEEDVYEDLLNKRGFIRVADYLAEDGMSFVSRGVYVSNTRQTGGYAQGVMQSIQNTYRGVNAVTGLTVNGTTSGVIAGLDQVDNYVQALNTAGTVNDPKEALRPVYDEYGVAFFERVINPDLIQKHMAPPQNLALMLGVWAGRQVEEKAAEVYNNLLVDELRSTYDSRGKMEESMFIDIREEARKMDAYNRLTPAQRKTVKKPDAIYADSWNVIPPQTKFYIQEVFPEGFFVRKDQINTALGYAEPSITDMWTGKTRLSDSTQVVIQAISNLTLGKLKDGTSAMTLLQKGEEAVQSTVSFAKDLIVTRSLVVPYLNSQANVFNLVLRGVANKAIIKGYKEKLVEIEQYNENFKKRMYLSTQIQLNREDPNRVQILEDQIKVLDDQDRRMSIHPLIEAGAYKTISEGITEDDFDVLRGGFMDKVQEQVEKLPQVAQTIIKNGVLSRETKLYQLANKAVQYGDFIAKGVYYEHLTTVGGKTSKEALQIINEEFVNFSTPPGRVRTGLDKLGATWFLTYKIRVMKPALSQIRDNPLRALMVNAVVPGNDTAQASNLITATIDGRIGYSMGWDMLFNSPGLNPWANMMGW